VTRDHAARLTGLVDAAYLDDRAFDGEAAPTTAKDKDPDYR
jgi:hypothetical protein